MPLKRSKSNRDPAFASAARFEVDWGGPEGSAGFLRVDFGRIELGGEGGELVLTRAIGSRRDLLDWMEAAGQGKPPAPRKVIVTLFDAAGRQVVRIAALGARPRGYSISPLDALVDGIVTESLTLAYTGLALVD